MLGHPQDVMVFKVTYLNSLDYYKSAFARMAAELLLSRQASGYLAWIWVPLCL